MNNSANQYDTLICQWSDGAPSKHKEHAPYLDFNYASPSTIECPKNHHEHGSLLYKIWRPRIKFLELAAKFHPISLSGDAQGCYLL